MKPVSLSLTNFGPFKQTQTFRFPSEPGLYFLWGDNQEEPRLGANGAGKSKLWQALVWVIFGKTSSGLKAGDAANWENGKGCRVVFKFVCPLGLTHELTRTWSPISWTLQAEDGQPQDLTKDANPFLYLLKLGLAPFLNSVLIAQGEPMFLDLKPDPKAALFAAVMDLDRWLDYSSKASKKASEWDQVCRGLERDVAGLEAQLEQLRDVELERRSDDWVKQQKRRRDELAEKYANLLAEHDKIGPKLKQADADEEVARDILQRATIWLDDLVDAHNKARQFRANAKTQVEVIKARAADAAHWAEHLDGGQCPTCGQAVTTQQMKATVADVDALLAEAKRAADELAEAREVEEAALRALEAQEAAEARARATLDNLRASQRDLARSLQRLDAELDRIEDQDEALREETNPYAALLARQDDARAQLERDLRRAKRRLDDADAQFRLCSYYVRWFKEIRLGLIAEALTQMEIEVNSALTSKGLVGWELRFEIDKETKSGGYSRGFNVSVLSPHNDRPVPWEAWSGGESQRLRVAAQEGLANLIRSRTGATLNLEVWDEPTQWMSAGGVNDLLNSLAARAETERRQIWIVDHRSLGYGGFKGSCGVIKSPRGHSYFDQSGLYISGNELDADAVRRSPHDVRRARTKARRT